MEETREHELVATAVLGQLFFLEHLDGLGWVGVIGVAGIAMAHKDDNERLERGAAVFDGLYEYFKRQRSSG